MNRLRKLALAIAGAVGVAVLLVGVTVRLGGKPVFVTEGGAIDGYDPVGYFMQGEAVRGRESITTEWNGATWRFASEENRDRFALNPPKYAPQYGGYCAYGLSEGYLAPVDPQAWTIVEDRLYLNFDISVMENWRETKERRIPLANQHWENH